LILSWAITIHKSQGLTLEKAVIEVGTQDFAPGLSFVAISRVKTLNGILFRSPFPETRFQRPNQSSNMKQLENDTLRRRHLENWSIDDYGQDLTYYLDAFDLNNIDEAN
jgi:ATP-dependent DNA helicase PIF1